MKKYLLAIILMSASLFAQMLEPRIRIEQNDFDFGTIDQGKVFTHNFKIINIGTDTLKIYDVKPGCGCTAAKPEKNILLPNESTTIKIDFNSEGRSGEQIKTVTILSNDTKEPESLLKFHGIVRKPPVDLTKNSRIVFKETSYNFGKVKEGTIVSHSFTFTNNGKVNLVINDVSSNCDCAAATVNTKTIKPGESGILKIDLNSKDREGKMSRNITVFSNDPEEPSKIISIYAEVIR